MVLENNSRNSMNTNEQSEQLEQSTNRKRIIQTIIDLVVIVIIFAVFIIVWAGVEPRIRFLTCDQSDIFFPFIKDTVPFWAVGIYATIGPILFIVFIELLNARMLPLQNKTLISANRRRRKFLICMFHGLSLFILGIAITLCLTEIGKKWVGRLRPHFIAVCMPDWSKVSCIKPAQTGSVYNSINTAESFCSGDASKTKEARLSFPSGHASYSCYAMLFLIIYVEARLFLLRLRYIKPLIQMTALIAAFITCTSRISDYHHRGTDVVGGSLLGAAIAYFITFFVGRVIWEYEAEKVYSDFDLKPAKNGEMYRL